MQHPLTDMRQYSVVFMVQWGNRGSDLLLAYILGVRALYKRRVRDQWRGKQRGAPCITRMALVGMCCGVGRHGCVDRHMRADHVLTEPRGYALCSVSAAVLARLFLPHVSA